MSLSAGGTHISPRQGKLLQLAAEGLSDQEIAGRFRISERELRVELEGLFAKLGVRSRERAIIVWSGAVPGRGLPEDRCPYHRPFPNGFSDCVAYRPRRVPTLDVKNEPTAAIWTCRNLRANPREEIGWYAACAMGRPADRERWAAEQPEENRLGVVDALTQDLAMFAGPFARRLWSLKRDQHLALAAGHDPTSATGAMEALGDGFMHDLTTVLQRHRSELDRHELSIQACLSLARLLIALIVPDTAPAEWDERFDRLLRLPEDAWAA